MPKPKPDESKAQFIKRCIPFVISEGTATDGTQAAAICHSIWNKREGKSMDTPNDALDDNTTVETVEIESNPSDSIIESETPLDPDPPSVAVKALREDENGVVVGGYLLLFGDEEHKDLAGEFFTPDTELWMNDFKSVPTLFHHGLDKTVQLSKIGHRAKAHVDPVGLWVESWLDKSNKFWKMVKPLLDAEALYYSPGSAGHLVKATETGELTSFPIIEDTLTVTPAQLRLAPVEQIKAAIKAAGVDLPEEDDPNGEDAGASCEETRTKAHAIAKAVLTHIQLEENTP